MFCPKCKAEYREGFLECSHCWVPLVPELSAQPELAHQGLEVHPEDVELVTVLTTGDAVAIEAAQSILEDAEIDYHVENEGSLYLPSGGRLGPFKPVIGPAFIHVSQKDESEARKALEHLQEHPTDLTCSECGATVSADDRVCPSCGESFEE